MRTSLRLNWKAVIQAALLIAALVLLALNHVPFAILTIVLGIGLALEFHRLKWVRVVGILILFGITSYRYVQEERAHRAELQGIRAKDRRANEVRDSITDERFRDTERRFDEAQRRFDRSDIRFNEVGGQFGSLDRQMLKISSNKLSDDLRAFLDSWEDRGQDTVVVGMGIPLEVAQIQYQGRFEKRIHDTIRQFQRLGLTDSTLNKLAAHTQDRDAFHEIARRLDLLADRL